jgi:ribosomal protein L31
MLAIEVTKKSHPFFGETGWIRFETPKMYFVEFDRKKTFEQRITISRGEIVSIEGPYWTGYILKRNVKLIPKANHKFCGSSWQKTGIKFLGKKFP